MVGQRVADKMKGAAGKTVGGKGLRAKAMSDVRDTAGNARGARKPGNSAKKADTAPSDVDVASDD
jgi:hypothetical protein